MNSNKNPRMMVVLKTILSLCLVCLVVLATIGICSAIYRKIKAKDAERIKKLEILTKEFESLKERLTCELPNG